MLVVKRTFIKSKVRMLETNQSNNWNLLCLDLISIEENVLKISSANENVWNMETRKKSKKNLLHISILQLLPIR